MTLPDDVPGPEHAHYRGWVHRAALRSTGRNVLLRGLSLEHQHDDVTHDHPCGYLTHRHSNYGSTPSTATSTWEKTMTVSFSITTELHEPPDLFDDVVLDAFADAGLPRWTAPLLVTSIDPAWKEPEIYEWEIVLWHESLAIARTLRVWDSCETTFSAAVLADHICWLLRDRAVR